MSRRKAGRPPQPIPDLVARAAARANFAPVVAYKFVEQQYLNAVLKGGPIRLGTLGNFREPDGIDSARSDRLEGAHVWQMNEGDTGTFSRGHPYLLAMGADWPELQTLTFASSAPDVKMVMTINAHVFCMSSEINREIVARMNADFGCDACYRINDVDELSRRIAGTFDVEVRMHVGRVSYSDEPSHTGSGPPDLAFNPFTKRTTYQWQKEVRICFDQPYNPTIEPINVRVPRIQDLVSPVDLAPFR